MWYLIVSIPDLCTLTYFTYTTLLYFTYIRLGSISIFPSRDIIIRNMTQDFKEQYPTTMLIVDCTEITVDSEIFARILFSRIASKVF